MGCVLKIMGPSWLDYSTAKIIVGGYQHGTLILGATICILVPSLFRLAHSCQRFWREDGDSQSLILVP